MSFIKIGSFYQRCDGKLIKITNCTSGDYPWCSHDGIMYNNEGLHHGPEFEWDIDCEMPNPSLVERQSIEGSISPDTPPALWPFDPRHSFQSSVVESSLTPFPVSTFATTTMQLPSPPLPRASEPRRPNRHAAIIKAWADGAEVQYKGPRMTEWRDLEEAGQSMTHWREDVEYRLKPQAPVLFIGLKGSVADRSRLVLTNSKQRIEDFDNYASNVILKIFKITVDPVTHDVISVESLPPRR